MLRRGVRPGVAVRRGRPRAGLPGGGGLLPAAARAALPPRQRPDAAAGRRACGFSEPRDGAVATYNGGGDFFGVGGYFDFAGDHAGMLLGVLPPIVHIRNESDKAALRWSMERLMQELREPQPGGFLMAQHLAHMMLVQALRLHVADGSKGGVGWLSALADKQMGAAISAMHDDPARRWTLQELARARRHVAIDLRPEIQGDGRGVADGLPDALANAAGRGQAGEFRRSHFRHRALARLRIRKRLQHSLQEGDGLFATAIWPRPDFGLPFTWPGESRPRQAARACLSLIACLLRLARRAPQGAGLFRLTRW